MMEVDDDRQAIVEQSEIGKKEKRENKMKNSIKKAKSHIKENRRLKPD